MNVAVTIRITATIKEKKAHTDTTLIGCGASMHNKEYTLPIQMTWKLSLVSMVSRPIAGIPTGSVSIDYLVT